MIAAVEEIGRNLNAVQTLNLSYNLISFSQLAKLAVHLTCHSSNCRLVELDLSGNMACKPPFRTAMDGLARILGLASLTTLRMDNLGIGLLTNRSDWTKWGEAMAGM